MSLARALRIAEPYLGRYGYLGIFVAVFVEGFGIPAPGQSLLVAGALLAGRGDLRIVPLVLTALGAAVLGDNLGYAIGRFGGRGLVLRAGHYAALRTSRLDRMESVFHRYGAAIVAVARFVDVLRQLNGIIAGLAGMLWTRFALFDAVGSILWVGVWGVGVYSVGEHANKIRVSIESHERYLVGAGICVVLIVLFGFLLRLPRRISQSHE
jgi:membrane protein DedA with SNARE-associated domain